MHMNMNANSALNVAQRLETMKMRLIDADMLVNGFDV